MPLYGAMRIEGYSQLANTALVKVSALQSWSIGQIFSATVIGRGNENSILLNVGGESVQTRSQLPLTAGQQLTLRVVNTLPNAVLAVVGATAPLEDVIASAMNESLPRQQPMNALTSAIAAALADSQGDASTAAKLTDLVRAAMKDIPARATLDTAGRLQRAVAQSGLLLEATLAGQVQAGNPAPPVEDFKWQLLQLRAALAELTKLPPPPPAPEAPPPHPVAQAQAAARPTSVPLATGQLPSAAPGAAPAATPAPNPAVAAPHATSATAPGGPPVLDDSAALPRLGHAVDGALARIETHQLNAANAQLSGQIYVVAEIPVRMTNENLQFVRLEIEEAAQGAATSERDTGLNIVVEVPVTPTETVAARIRLLDRTVAVTLWSDDEQLQQRIGARRDELAANLAAAGFTVGGVMLGRVTPTDTGSRLPSRLIDAKV